MRALCIRNVFGILRMNEGFHTSFQICIEKTCDPKRSMQHLQGRITSVSRNIQYIAINAHQLNDHFYMSMISMATWFTFLKVLSLPVT